MGSFSQYYSGFAQYDLFSDLKFSENPITDAITLSNSDLSKFHLVSGTTANYTITLPPVAGNAGRLIGFRIASDATELFTLDGNSSELIDGEETRVMWKNESAILLCDGTSWSKVGGKSIAMKTRLTKSSTQNVSSETSTKITFDGTEFDDGLADLTNNEIIVRRDGIYRINGGALFDPTISATRCLIRLYVNNIWVAGSESRVATRGGGTISITKLLNTSTRTIYIDVFHNDVSSETLGSTNTFLEAEEVLQW